MQRLPNKSSPAQLERIDDLADKFEAAFDGSSFPNIEDYLGEDPELRPHLLPKLLTLDVQIRRSIGQTPQSDDYRERFPEAGALIDRLFFLGVTQTAAGAEADGTPAEDVTKQEDATPNPAETLDIADASKTRLGGSPITLGRRFGDYELIEEISRGGMGVVYKARQVKLNRIVALKMILSGQHASETEVRRFQIEAEAAANLQHPSIVPIYEIAECEATFYFSMAFIDGESLAGRLKLGPLRPRNAALVTRKISEAVAYAHAQGVIHRDLKPGNVLLDSRDNPMLTDFGLAKKVETDSSLTRTGAIMGTPSFMPPEQAAGRTGEVGPRSDVYSLGAVLYCALTGRPPFQAATSVDTLLQVIERDPVSPRRLNSGLPVDLETICMKCLEKDVSHRYQTAEDFTKELDRYLAGKPILARPISHLERAWRWSKRRPAVAILALATLVLLIVLGTAGPWVAIREAALREESDRNARDAQRATIAMLKQKNHAEDLAYTSDMLLVEQLWRNSSFLPFKKIVERHQQNHRKNFEWNYWNRLANNARSTIQYWEGMAVKSVAYSPDGKQIAAAVSNGEVWLFDTATETALRVINAHKGEASTVSFSLDGQRIVTGGEDKTIRIWNVQTGMEEMQLDNLRLDGHRNAILKASLSPNGRRILTVARLSSSPSDSSIFVTVWDVQKRQKLFELSRLDSSDDKTRIKDAAFSPDGTYLALAAPPLIAVVDAATGKKKKQFHANGNWLSNTAIAYFPGGEKLASMIDDRLTIISDTSSGSAEQQVIELTDTGVSLGISSNGAKIATALSDGSVEVRDSNSGRLVSHLRGHEEVFATSFSPDGFSLATAGYTGDEATLKTWNLLQPRNPSIVSSDSWFDGLAFSPNGKQLAMLSPYGSRIVDTVTRLTSLKLKDRHSHKWHGMAFDPSGEKLFVASPDQIGVWDLKSGEVIRKSSGRYSMLKLFNDGNRIAAVSSNNRGKNNSITILDSNTFRIIKVLEEQPSPISSFDVRPDEKEIITSSLDMKIRTFDVQSGKIVSTVTANGSVFDVKFSPNGEQFASASLSKTIQVWDSISKRQTLVLEGHAQSCQCVSFSLDGRRLASGSFDRTVKLWDVESGNLLMTLGGHEGGVWDVTFSNDGMQIASSTFQGDVRIWDARPWTDQLRIEATARGLMSHVQDSSPSSLEEFQDRIRSQAAISEKAKVQAIGWSERYWDAAVGPVEIPTDTVVNGDFEEPFALHSRWQCRSYKNADRQDIFLHSENEGRDESACLLLHSPGDANDIMAWQAISVEPNTNYYATMWLKTQNVDSLEGGGVGGNLSIWNGERAGNLLGDQDWTKVILNFNSGNRTRIEIGPRLGHHGSMCIGKIWADDLRLEKLPESARTPAIPDSQVDILALVTPEKCWREGVWTKHGESLESPNHQAARLELPYITPDEYRMTAIVEPLDKPNTLVLGQRVFGRRFHISLGYPTPGGVSNAIHSVDGEKVGTVLGNRFTQNQFHEIVVTVIKERINVAIDGQEVINWKGDLTRLTPSRYWTTPNKEQLLVGSYRCRYRFHRLSIEPISGEGEVIAAILAP